MGGPDSGEGEVVRYGRVGSYGGIDFDLVVSLGAGEDTFMPKHKDSEGTPMEVSTGCLADHYRARLQFVNGRNYTFDFEIQRSDSHAPYTLPGFSMYFNDLDGAAEWVSPIGASSWTLFSPTSLVQESTPLNPTFKATDSNNVPSASDPDPNKWEDVQKAASVGFHFQHTASFQVRLGILAKSSSGAAPPDGCFTREDGGGQVCSVSTASATSGRGFGFTGVSNLGTACPPLPPAAPLPPSRPSPSLPPSSPP